MPEIITSKDNKRIKSLVHLQDHPSPSSFVVEGDHAVEVAYEQGCLKEVFALEDPRLEGIPCTLVSEAVMKKLSRAVSYEKIIGVCALKEHAGYASNVLVLDRVQDPGNVGTLLRSASSFGFEDVVFLKGSCSPMNSKVIASCEGALFHLRLHFEDEKNIVESLHDAGYLVLGSALRNAKMMETYALNGKKVALILGNEGQGMSEYLLSKTDDNLKISMAKMESLNVGVAGGILMHYLSESSK